jgi:hypothetical protein
MSKKTSEGAPRITRPTNGERTPPLLSEKLIAKLQGAVDAAQRRRRQPYKYALDSNDHSSQNPGDVRQFRSAINAARGIRTDDDTLSSHGGRDPSPHDEIRRDEDKPAHGLDAERHL